MVMVCDVRIEVGREKEGARLDCLVAHRGKVRQRGRGKAMRGLSHPGRKERYAGASSEKEGAPGGKRGLRGTS